jgi:carbamoyltransferase
VIICGLKLTHDGGVALLDESRLVFSVEMEKLNNNHRHCSIEDLGAVRDILADFGYSIADVNEWVVDGWDGDRPGQVSLLNNGMPISIPRGTYRESKAAPDILRPSVSSEFSIDGHPCRYTSYSHAAGHLASAYCSSPFAAAKEPAFALIWDGGMFPMLYWIDPSTGVANGGSLFPIIGHAYATAAHHFGRYRRVKQSANVDDLSVAGKLMAYIALGKSRTTIKTVLRRTFEGMFDGDSLQALSYQASVHGYGSLSEPSMQPLHDYYNTVRILLDGTEVCDDDVLASVHDFLGELLVERLPSTVRQWKGNGPWHLCLAGGCALNIKWNSALRGLSCFDDVWVPPFVNDSGSAIGAAALGMIRHSGLGSLSWDVHLGPDMLTTANPGGWTANPCDIRQLAAVLHETGRPVVVLSGRAELGPRALGGRSILAAATTADMKDELNRIKGRESYRPVAPICLAREAPRIFAPGTPDPYMLFDHEVRPEWVSRVPAIVHLDGTARLQTVDESSAHDILELLTHYHQLSGIPLLCNTSANYNGRGFFPDVASAMQWGRVDRIWSDNTIHQRVTSS